MSQNSNQVCSQAVIKEVGDSYVVAEIVIESACAACHAKSACGVSDRKQEKIKVSVDNPEDFTVGEFVHVEMKQSLGLKAVEITVFDPFRIVCYLPLTSVIIITISGVIAYIKFQSFF
jgi:sigma-E factor negative regulatory protein RseC